MSDLEISSYRLSVSRTGPVLWQKVYVMLFPLQLETNFLEKTLNTKQTRKFSTENILSASLRWVYNIICTSNYISSYDLVMPEE